jgi:hypothetical protein
MAHILLEVNKTHWKDEDITLLRTFEMSWFSGLEVMKPA